MNCDIIRDLMPLYADGIVSESSRRLIDEHTAACPACREILSRMCAPMEPEPADETQKLIDALHAQRRRQILRVVIPCVFVALVCIFGWWIYMETHFYGTSHDVVSTDGERILQEVPALALTQAELDLADTVMDIPPVRESLGTTDWVNIPPEQAGAIQSILPEDAAFPDIGVYGVVVFIDYQHDGQRIILEYINGDRAGTADAIRKSIGVYEGEEEKQEVNDVYSLDYSLALGKTWYEKRSARHVWFSFLNMP